jgi:hypothetical protein
MPEMPIEQDYDRHIAPLSGEEVLPEGDESIYELLEQDDAEIEELEDGSAIVRLPTRGPDESPDFYENLADRLDSWKMSSLALKYLDLIEKDKEAREDRDKQYEEGLRRTGLGHDAPGGASFMGASKVVHPVMAESCVDFSARAIKEMFPPDGPVRTKIIGEVDDKKVQRAERKRDYMNWQLTEQIPEFRDEEEQLASQLPLGGSQYLKMWHDAQQRRPRAEFVPIDNIYLPFAAGNFYTASRVTEVQDITQEEYEMRISSGLYIDTEIFRASEEPEESKAEKANNKIEGRKSQADNIDGIRRVYHITTWLELEDDSFSKGERAPYIMMIDENERTVVGLYRNWEDGDDTLTKLDWIVEFKFIPWRGAYAIGLPHLIGGLSAALTGALRALLDSAHINTAPTMLKLKGAKISGQSQVIEPTQVSEIEGAPGVDDVRKIAMPVPFNQPSPVLFQLLGWLDNAAKGVVSTSEEKIADANNNMPVGTAQALIEQGAVVFSSVHARLHESQKKVLMILARLNRWYMDEYSNDEMAQELGVTKDDFERNTDVIPVSDPHIFAESQRYAQIQTLAARAAANPDLYNRLEVEKRILKQIKIPDVNGVLPDPHEVEDMNPALENVAMTLGRPVGAFPKQDHLAHFLAHLNYAQDPIFGANPIVAPTFMPACLEHLKQHLTLWYLNQVDGYTSTALGKPFDALKVQPILSEAQRLLAAVTQHVHQDSKMNLAEVGSGINQMLQMLRNLQQSPQLPTDPNVMAQVKAMTDASMAETNRKAAYDRADLQLKAQKQNQDAQEKQASLVSQQQIENAKLTHDANVMTIEKKFEANQAQAEMQHEAQLESQQHLQDMQKAEQQAQIAAIQSQAAPQPQGESNV